MTRFRSIKKLFRFVLCTLSRYESLSMNADSLLIFKSVALVMTRFRSIKKLLRFVLWTLSRLESWKPPTDSSLNFNKCGARDGMFPFYQKAVAFLCCVL